MKRIGLQVPDHPNACYGQTMYNLVHLPGGKCRVDWWTSDNFDQGCPSMPATRSYNFDDEAHANAFVVGRSDATQPLDHSWLGLYGNPVFVHVDGKLLPFRW